MGNKIASEYKLPELNSASGGNGSVWKIYTGTKIQTNEERSVWIFERKSMEKLKKADQDKFVTLLHKEFQNLARLRHPLVIHVSRPIDESQGTIFVETEPVFCSLANAMKRYKNIPSVPQPLSRFHLEPLEIQLGIVQICEALVFLHTGAHIIHRNITPDSIFIMPDSTWKLGGFTFSTYMQYKHENKEFFQYPDTESVEDFPTRPNLNYIAPELLFINDCDYVADMFSLGCVIYESFEGRPLLPTGGSAAVYKRLIESLFPISFEKTPQQLRPVIEGLVTVDPTKRWTAQQVLQSEAMNDLPVRVLKFLAHIVEQDDRNKAEFFKGLQTALPHFTVTLLERKVLPPLLTELRNHILVPFILPTLFQIADMLDKSIFVKKIFPALIPLFSIKEPFQIVLSLLQRVEFLMNHLPEKERNDYVLSLISTSLDHEKFDVKIAALKVLAPIVHHFEYEKIKSILLPKLQLICTSPNAPSKARVASMYCYSKIIPLFNRSMVEETILPVVFRTMSTDRSPAVLMGAVGVCDVISCKFGEMITATKLIPLIAPIAVEPTLTRPQFDAFMKIFQGMISRIAQHRMREFDEQQMLKEKENTKRNLEDFDRFKQFNQLVRSSTEAIAAPPPPKRGVLEQVSDATKVESFQALIQKQEERRERANEQRKNTVLLDLEGSNPEPSPVQDHSARSTSSHSLDTVLLATPTTTPPITPINTTTPMNDQFNQILLPSSHGPQYSSNPTLQPLQGLAGLTSSTSSASSDGNTGVANTTDPIFGLYASTSSTSTSTNVSMMYPQTTPMLNAFQPQSQAGILAPAPTNSSTSLNLLDIDDTFSVFTSSSMQSGTTHNSSSSTSNIDFPF